MDACNRKSIDLTNIKWVFFDMGGVLVDSRPLFSYMADSLYWKLHVDAEFLKKRIMHCFARLKSEKASKLLEGFFMKVYLKLQKSLVWKLPWHSK